jgi:hypothetical protein
MHIVFLYFYWLVKYLVYHQMPDQQLLLLYCLFGLSSVVISPLDKFYPTFLYEISATLFASTPASVDLAPLAFC